MEVLEVYAIMNSDCVHFELVKTEDDMDWKRMWEKLRYRENLQETIPITDYNRKETTGRFGIFKIFG